MLAVHLASKPSSSSGAQAAAPHPAATPRPRTGSFIGAQTEPIVAGPFTIEASPAQKSTPIDSNEGTGAAGNHKEEPVDEAQGVNRPIKETSKGVGAAGNPKEEPVDDAQGVNRPIKETSKGVGAAGNPKEEPVDDAQGVNRPIKEAGKGVGAAGNP